MQLYYVEFKDESGIYVKEDEYDDFAKTMALLSIKYTAVVVTEPMYAIHWYDYIDDEWNIEWCTEDEFDEMMTRIIIAEAEWNVETFNM